MPKSRQTVILLGQTLFGRCFLVSLHHFLQRQGRPELLDQYGAVRKKFIVVSNTGQDNFTAAFRCHTGDAPPDVLFLSARRFGKVSIHGDLMDSPEARDTVLHFIH